MSFWRVASDEINYRRFFDVNELAALNMEREDIGLAIYAVFYRSFYILIIDVTKLFATLEELVGLDMSWGKLARKGRI